MRASTAGQVRGDGVGVEKDWEVANPALVENLVGRFGSLFKMVMIGDH